jgi:hypothetical protein
MCSRLAHHKAQLNFLFMFSRKSSIIVSSCWLPFFVVVVVDDNAVKASTGDKFHYVLRNTQKSLLVFFQTLNMLLH